MADQNTFQLENDQLLTFILENRFFKVWRDREGQNGEPSMWRDTNIELFITPTCNLKCEYCYLQRYSDGLYPKEYRDKEQILRNMRTLFEWFLKEGFSAKGLDLFSGEIWHTPFGFEVLDVVLEYARKGVLFEEITIPTNCTFIVDDENMNRMQNYIDDLSALGTRLIISCSIEGAVLEKKTRPFADKKKNSTRDERFYDKLFAFAKKNNYLFHPMVAAANVKDWIENYEWYEQQIADYKIDTPSPIMMLEVRNGDWTDESIADLLKFYDYQLDRQLKECGGSVKALSEFLVGKNSQGRGYLNYALPLANNHPGCSVATHLCVRLGDLAICPCHRTSYDKLLYGKFKVEDGEIVGITCNNPQMAIRVLGGNNKIDHHGCDVCPYNGLCMRGCFGAQYEYAGDAFMPVDSVCKMFKAKINHLIDRYIEIGIIDEWRKSSEYEVFYMYIQRLLGEIDRVQEYRKGGGR